MAPRSQGWRKEKNLRQVRGAAGVVEQRGGVRGVHCGGGESAGAVRYVCGGREGIWDVRGGGHTEGWGAHVDGWEYSMCGVCRQV